MSTMILRAALEQLTHIDESEYSDMEDMAKGIREGARSALARAEQETSIERFQRVILDKIQGGLTGFHFTTGQRWHSMTIEQKCEFILSLWAVQGTRSGPAQTGKTPQDVRSLV